MQNEEWNVSAVSLSPELVRLAQQKQARLDACLQAAENGNEAAITELGINYFYGINGVPEDPDAAFYWLSRTRRKCGGPLLPWGLLCDRQGNKAG